MRFTARPRMGGRRAVGRRCRGGSRRDRPLKGSRPRPPPGGEGGDGGKFLRGFRLQGVSYLIDGFGVSIRNPRNSSKIRVCNPATIFADFVFLFFFFLREDVVMSHLVRARSSAALMSLG